MLPFRLMAAFAAAFGILGLVLAMSGLYGVLSYSVTRRRKAIAIRMALGAGGAEIQLQEVRRGLALTLAGLALGVLLALAAGRALSGLLVGVSATDPLTFLLVCAALTACAAAASLAPARRASRLSVMTALREA
jgi:ABC-type antimicrobial peptide transport system permease subunit